VHTKKEETYCVQLWQTFFIIKEAKVEKYELLNCRYDKFMVVVDISQHKVGSFLLMIAEH